MKIMFLDESGDHSLCKIDESYPVFVLAGCIFDEDYYQKIVIRQVNDLKIKYFQSPEIIFRSYDIRKQKGAFSCLCNPILRENFYNDLSNLIRDIEFKIIGSVIHKKNLMDRYSDPNNPYELCFNFILERAIMFLGRSNDKMCFRIESRESHNDKKLYAIFSNFLNGHNNFFECNEVKTKLTDLHFPTKKQNVIGNQIADLIAYPIGKYSLDKTHISKSFEIIEKKIHHKDGNYKGIGLKIFP